MAGTEKKLDSLYIKKISLHSHTHTLTTNSLSFIMESLTAQFNALMSQDIPEIVTMDSAVQALIDRGNGKYECDCETHTLLKKKKITKEKLGICELYHVNYWAYLDEFKKNHANPNVLERKECIAVKCECHVDYMKDKSKLDRKAAKLAAKTEPAQVEPVPEPVPEPEVKPKKARVNKKAQEPEETSEPEPKVVVVLPKKGKATKSIVEEIAQEVEEKLKVTEKPKAKGRKKKTPQDLIASMTEVDEE